MEIATWVSLMQHMKQSEVIRLNNTMMLPLHSVSGHWPIKSSKTFTCPQHPTMNLLFTLPFFLHLLLHPARAAKVVRNTLLDNPDQQVDPLWCKDQMKALGWDTLSKDPDYPHVAAVPWVISPTAEKCSTCPVSFVCYLVDYPTSDMRGIGIQRKQDSCRGHR